MKQKLGSQEIDFLTQQELDRSLRGVQEWLIDVAKGIRPIRFNAQATANSSGLIELGGATTLTGGSLGPRPSFWWSVSRLAVRVDGAPAPFSLYINGAHSNSLVRDVTGDPNGYLAFGAQELLVGNEDTLYIRTSSTIPTTGYATVTGGAIEIPNSLMWKWLNG